MSDWFVVSKMEGFELLRGYGSARTFIVGSCCHLPHLTLQHKNASIARPPNSMTTSTSSATQVEQPPPPPPPPDPQRTAEARAAFTAHLTSIGNTHISTLEARTSDIHNNATAIAKQEADIAKHTKNLAAEAKKHQKVANDAAEKLKELGDIQNWAEVLERDLLVLEETMRMGEEGEGEDGWGTEEEEMEEVGDEREGGAGCTTRGQGQGKKGERLNGPA